jgi:GT2 family glycosyltransferase
MSQNDLSRDELAGRLATRTAELESAYGRIRILTEKNTSLKRSKSKLKASKEKLLQQREELRRSPEYKLGRIVTNLLGKRLLQWLGPVFPILRREPPPVPAPAEGLQSPHPLKAYHEWWLLHRPTAADLESRRAAAAALVQRPLISIVMPTYNTPLKMLDDAIESVRAQIYSNWELVIADDASPDPQVAARLREWQAKDARIRVNFLAANCGIALASNAAMELARGEFVALLDHDDWIEPDALDEIVQAIAQNPEADFIYSDEDKVDPSGFFQQPFFKPDWSPEMMMSCNYLCHFSAIRTALLQQLGGFRTGFDGAQDYDLFLRVTEQARSIVHVPKILYHWRLSEHSTSADSGQKPAAVWNGKRALEDALARRGIEARVEATDGARYRVRYALREAKKISILIPTRDRLDLLATCIASIEAKTAYPNYEIVIINNGSEKPETLQYFAETRHRVIHYDGPFNYSALCNYGVRESDGEWLLLLNNDVEIIEPGWLTAMAEQIQREEIGAVGAKLLFADGTVQHAGVYFCEHGARHAFHGAQRYSGEQIGQLQIVRNYSAVTAACLLTRRDVYNAVGGLDEVRFAVAFNDTDLCLRIRKQGYRIVYTPYAELFHYESQSRGYENQNPEESKALRETWPEVLAHDPYFNPNLAEAQTAN